MRITYCGFRTAAIPRRPTRRTNGTTRGEAGRLHRLAFPSVRAQHAGLPDSAASLDNCDISWEHRFPGTDFSFKVTPYLDKHERPDKEFFLIPKLEFTSGLNAGSQRSEGVEIQIQRETFARDGISGFLSFAYTNSYIRYGGHRRGRFRHDRARERSTP